MPIFLYRETAADTVCSYPDRIHPEWGALRQAGLLDYQVTDTNYVGTYACFPVLTQAGESAMQPWRKTCPPETRCGEIVIAIREFVGVTGLSPDGDSQVNVQYQRRWKKTELGIKMGALVNQTVDENIETDQASFRKYDDGWRIERISSRIF
jgi:hypothetical protein